MRRVNEKTLFWAFFVLLIYMSLSLIWSYSFNPFVDEPSVVSSAVAFHYYDDTKWGFKEWYRYNEKSISHTAYYRIMALLFFFFSPITASKILISILVLAIPLSMLSFFTVIGKSKWLSLAGFALAFNDVLNMGFIPYFMGIPVWIVTLFLIEHNNKAFKWWKILLLTLIVACSPYVHFLFSCCLIATYFYWTLMTYSDRNRLIAGLSIPSAALVVFYLIYSNRFVGLDIATAMNAMRRVPLLETVTSLSSVRLLVWTKDGFDALSGLMLLSSVTVVLVVKPTKGPSTEGGLWGKIRSYKSEILMMLFLGASLLGPNWLDHPYSIYDIPSRLVIYVAVLFVGTPWYREQKIRDVTVFLPLLLVVIMQLYSLREPFFQFGKEARFLEDVSEEIPLGSVVYPAYIHYDMNPVGTKNFGYGDFYRSINFHLPEWVTAIRGGYNPFTFCDHPFHIFECKKKLPAPGSHARALISPEQISNYEYMVLFENYLPGEKIPDALLLLQTDHLEFVTRKGRWSLWKVNR